MHSTLTKHRIFMMPQTVGIKGIEYYCYPYVVCVCQQNAQQPFLIQYSTSSWCVVACVRFLVQLHIIFLLARQFCCFLVVIILKDFVNFASSKLSISLWEIFKFWYEPSPGWVCTICKLLARLHITFYFLRMIWNFIWKFIGKL